MSWLTRTGILNILGLSALSGSNTGDESNASIIAKLGADLSNKALATDVAAALLLKAAILSPTFTGVPLAPTANPGTNTQQIASTAFVQAAVAALINTAPGALDTLDELAAAFGDDPNFAATMATALAGKQPIDADLTAIALLTTTSYGRALLELADAAALRALVVGVAPNSSYRNLMNVAGSHIAGKVAGIYGIGMGDPAAVTGTGTLYPLGIIYIDPNDFPTVNGLTTKLRVRGQIYVNDVAPTGNYTMSLHPVTRPGTSGGAGLDIYTIGAAIAGSGVTVNTPAADSMNVLAGADFAIPAAGHYVIAITTTGTVATSSLVQIVGFLQMRNT